MPASKATPMPAAVQGERNEYRVTCNARTVAAVGIFPGGPK